MKTKLHGVTAAGVIAVAIASAAACSRSGAAPSQAASVAGALPTDAAANAPGISPPVTPTPEASALSDAFAAVAKAIRPSVVRIDVEGRMGMQSTPEGPMPDVPEFLRRFFDFEGAPTPAPRRLVRGTGSGVIVDQQGNVLTNAHVIRGASKVTIQLADQRSFPAHVVGADPLTDVGVVRFDKPPAGLIAARLGDSDKLRIGEWSIAVGSPLGMDQTVTVGIISGVGETGSHFRFESGERVRRYIQTDAKINPGNSGGPLLNLRGEVIGINTLINVGPGGSYGFAIPIKQAWHVAGLLIKEGRVRYPYIGVSVVTLSETSKEMLPGGGRNLPSEGALVASVTPGGPAASAGLKAGDVITKVAGKPAKTAGDVVSIVSDHKIGDNIPVEWWRDGATNSTQIKIGEYPAEGAAQAGGEGPRIGVALQTLTPELAGSLGLDPSTKGAVITEVVPDSPAAHAGLAPGDVIREIDRKPVTSAEDAVTAMRAGKGAHLLRVTSGRGTRFVTVKPE